MYVYVCFIKYTRSVVTIHGGSSKVSTFSGRSDAGRCKCAGFHSHLFLMTSVALSVRGPVNVCFMLGVVLSRDSVVRKEDLSE
jgi:hypothetical protein